MQWFEEHQDLLRNPFYVGGDSYAGKIVPYLVQKISEGRYGLYSSLLNFSSINKFSEYLKLVPLNEDIFSRWK